MKNIHLIPTDKPSRLHFDEVLFISPNLQISNTINSDVEGRIVYVTNDEEIKERDWLFDLDIKRIVKADNLKVLTSQAIGCWYYKKVILSTDQELIKDGVQAIDDDFLEWFVKNPSCESVEIIYTNCANCVKIQGQELSPDCCHNYQYKIITQKEEPKMIECYFIPSNNTSSATICGNCGKEKMLHTIGSGIKVSKSVIITKEEPKPIHQQIIDAVGGEDRFRKICKIEPKQETLEEAAERLYPTPNPYIMGIDIGNSLKRDGFKEGAKWQQKRMYSEEDLRNAYRWGTSVNHGTKEHFNEWFEKLKRNK